MFEYWSNEEKPAKPKSTCKKNKMGSNQYINPWRGAVRTLESNITKYRAMQMVLAITYAEEIRRIVVSAVQTVDKFQMKMGKENVAERIPDGTSQPFQKAVKIWEAEGLLSGDEANLIRRLTNYRNDIAHRTHELVADLSNHRIVRSFLSYKEKSFSTYDYTAADEMRTAIELLNDRLFKAQRMTTLDLNSTMFETAERALHRELKSLRCKIDKLMECRRGEIATIRKELTKINDEFLGEKHPGHSFNTYDDGRLTARGVEICYRLFDAGHSVAVVAHALRLSINSARNRKKLWLAAGGENRPVIAFDELPIRKFHRRYDD